ncbi:NADH dehydrogenase [ubiquinone] 1 beta subcomplex subunit 3-like [Ostrea edulis]|uniref:NADH dehydrogenase [ubiquinone] 1 beta subcomplex subunit 3-like n=1 Tax=Ostrea edulis TaxID=37623 RepID=UPI0020965F08|nr:NADH dehydrogenase [ubiquinone] 1 beta subcomplex subunit 3-like [Ostrea edulis]
MASNFPKVKWEYDLADSFRVICGLVPKKLPETPKFDPWDVKTYKVEHCIQELHDYQKKLAEKGLKDPWIRNEVWHYHKDIHINQNFTRWQLFGRMLVPGIIIGGFLAYLKVNYFTYHDYEGREEKWKHHH